MKMVFSMAEKMEVFSADKSVGKMDLYKVEMLAFSTADRMAAKLEFLMADMMENPMAVD
jgi:hypothetical protein